MRGRRQGEWGSCFTRTPSVSGSHSRAFLCLQPGPDSWEAGGTDNQAPRAQDSPCAVTASATRVRVELRVRVSRSLTTALSFSLKSSKTIQNPPHLQETTQAMHPRQVPLHLLRSKERKWIRNKNFWNDYLFWFRLDQMCLNQILTLSNIYTAVPSVLEEHETPPPPTPLLQHT